MSEPKVDSSISELMTVCASILEDSEVTILEAYDLADWLNNHPDAATSWPGGELVKPLQEIWADGSVSQRELHRLTRLLVSLQREWARHPAANIRAAAGCTEPEMAATNLDTVTLPSVAATFHVPSHSEQSRVYDVDLRGPSCSCPDWTSWRSHLPIGDLSRCCKHVLQVYAKLARRERTDRWLMAFIDNAWPAHPAAQWRLLTNGSRKILFCTASDKGWANVFAEQGSEYLRFGFNVDEDRWAYGSEPDGARAIADAIAACQRKASAH